jgi:hypothetical protein
MKHLATLAVSLLLMSAAAPPVHAWTLQGTVYCDGDQNGVATTGDIRLPDVLVIVTNTSGTYSNAVLTAPDGTYVLPLQAFADNYVGYVDASTLPATPVAVSPPTGTWHFNTDPTQQDVTADFLISSPDCQINQPATACSLTGNASIRSSKGRPLHGFGGSVTTDCSGAMGGNWSDNDHSRGLQFKSTAVQTAKCVIPIRGPNYVEFSGTGILRGGGGNKVSPTPVSFFAHMEDRSYFNRQPDLYYLRVTDASGAVLMLVSADPENPQNVAPVPIGSGDLKLQVTSCPQ